MKAKVASQGDSKRLDREAWIGAALGELAKRGIDGVRVERLAVCLGVTKGSFYWHFKGRQDLHDAMLDQWRRQATVDLIRRVDRDNDPRDRLHRLLSVPFAGKKADQAAEVELAVRLWGRRDARARDALAEVDNLRLRYLEQLIADCGAPASEATARAVLAYSYLRVAATLMEADARDLIEQCMALIVGVPANPHVRTSA